MTSDDPRAEREGRGGEHHLVALFGASNLALGFPRVVSALVARFRGAALSIYAARGCGRSYGLYGGVLGYKTPGLSACGLFAALEQAAGRLERPRVHALLTDLGNDILYRAESERIGEWLGAMTARLGRLRARVGVTSLPLESLRRLPSWKFRLLRPLFYPFRPMPLGTVLARAAALQEIVEALARERGFTVLEARASWYGFDHFHLRRGTRAAAFSGWLDAVIGASGPPPDPSSASEPLRLSPLALRYRRPAEDRLCGWHRRRSEEGVEVAAGVRLYCY